MLNKNSAIVLVTVYDFVIFYSLNFFHVCDLGAESMKMLESSL